jgi:hypothetical protein
VNLVKDDMKSIVVMQEYPQAVKQKKIQKNVHRISKLILFNKFKYYFSYSSKHLFEPFFVLIGKSQI